MMSIRPCPPASPFYYATEESEESDGSEGSEESEGGAFTFCGMDYPIFFFKKYERAAPDSGARRIVLVIFGESMFDDIVSAVGPLLTNDHVFGVALVGVETREQQGRVSFVGATMSPGQGHDFTDIFVDGVVWDAVLGSLTGLDVDFSISRVYTSGQAGSRVDSMRRYFESI